MIQSYMASDIGCVRAHNEDRLLVVENAQVYAVADGMGGQAAGEVASCMLVEVLQSDLSAGGLTEVDLSRSVLHANEKILASAAAHPQYQGMGTTATVLHIESGQALWAHVGDSRLYLYRQGALQQVTEDHSYVESLVREGKLTEEEARSHPQKNMLLRAVGVEKELEVDRGSFPLQEGDILLLATDGLMNMVSDQEIEKKLSCATEEFSESGSPAKELVRQALAAGGYDNVTVIVVVYG